MPLYEYECPFCGEFEAEHGMNERLDRCPECNHTVKKLISQIAGFVCSRLPSEVAPRTNQEQQKEIERRRRLPDSHPQTLQIASKSSDMAHGVIPQAQAPTDTPAAQESRMVEAKREWEAMPAEGKKEWAKKEAASRGAA